MATAQAYFLRHLRGLAGTEHTDRQLLERFASRQDEAAFAALVRRHGPLVLGVCRRVLGSESDAEDAFQAVFITLARKARRLGRKPLAGWLHTVARQAALDTRKATARRARMHRRVCEETALRAPPKSGDTDEARALVQEELSALPEKLRVPLALYYLEGKDMDAVAGAMGLKNRNVAKKKKHFALQRLIHLVRSAKMLLL